MPQVFGADELGLVAESSLWVEAGFLEDVEAHEAALHEAGFGQQELPVLINRSDFHPRGDVWGQHLTSDKTHHTWAVARVQNPEVDPNAKQFGIGGARPRYSVEIHKVPVNPHGRARPEALQVWEGNDIRQFITGQGMKTGQMAWPHIQQAMRLGPKQR